MNKYKLIFLALLLIFFGTIFFYGFILSWNIKCDHLSTTITIDKGYSVNDVSKVLENNLCINSTLFKIAMKMRFNEKNINLWRRNDGLLSGLLSLFIQPQNFFFM